MISQSESNALDRPMEPRELAAFGYAHAQHVAFDAILGLWRLRQQQEGIEQKELARVIGRHPSWVSRNLRGPKNWTMKTLGELCEGLHGYLEIKAYPIENCPALQTNYDAYAEAAPPQVYVASGFAGVTTNNSGSTISLEKIQFRT